MDELKFNLVPSSACESIARLLCMYIINFKNIIIMAKIINNKKGFKVISLTPEECTAIGFGCIFGTHKEILCDRCNDFITDCNEVYYIPVLNRVFCQECFINWYNTATNYPEDKDYEDNKYKAVMINLENKAIDVKTINVSF